MHIRPCSVRYYLLRAILPTSARVLRCSFVVDHDYGDFGVLVMVMMDDGTGCRMAKQKVVTCKLSS